MTDAPPKATSYDERPWMVGGLILVLAVTLALGIMVDFANYDVWAGSVTYLVLVVITVPALYYISKVDRDPKLLAILVWALLIKLLMSLVRYYVINVIYRGEADAAIYHSAGVYFSDHIKDGYAAVKLGPFMRGFPDESKHIGVVTGVTYLFTGPSQYAGFFVFSWFSFVGNLLLTRGFRSGFPEGRHRRYTVLVMFLPSLMFWPSSIGKEGWMMLNVGLVGYGAGKVLAPKVNFWGLVPIFLGVTGAGWVRPHMALVAAGSVLVGVAFWLLGGRMVQGITKRGRSVVTRIVVLGIVAVLAVGASSRLDEVFGAREDESAMVSTESKLDKTLRQTYRGGSKFETQPVRSPTDLPMATISVLFRPFPWEAGNINMLMSSAEGILFLLLGIYGWKSVSKLPSNLWRRPYLVFSLMYSMTFIVAFSNIANAGILARQRVQMLPLALVVLALPAERWWAAKRADNVVFDRELHPDGEHVAEDEAVDEPGANPEEPRYSDAVVSGVGGSPQAVGPGGMA